MSDFATHRRLLNTDDTYRAKFGLGPVPVSNGAAPAAASAATTRNGAPPLSDPLVSTANDALERATAALAAAQVAQASSTASGIDRSLFTGTDQLDQLRKELERVARAITVQVESDQERLVDMYVQTGTGLIEIDGRVGTLGSKIWARKIDEATTGEDVAGALVASGLAHLVTPPSYNSSQLSAYLRDLDEAGQPIPGPLAEVIEAYEKWRVGFTTRRATRAQRRMNGAPSSVVDGASQD
jgi:hypothetical protein